MSRWLHSLGVLESYLAKKACLVSENKDQPMYECIKFDMVNAYLTPNYFASESSEAEFSDNFLLGLEESNDSRC